MNDIVCDEFPLNETIKIHLQTIQSTIEKSIQNLHNEDHCIMSELDQMTGAMNKVVALASSFYLQCYLSGYSSRVGDLALTVKHLSERRHGGLIVIKREQHVGNILHSGIEVMAMLTSPLLESIFYPGNPLHDGAVLIDADIIVSAANILPVSQKGSLDTKLGTRHRAAIGLSEASDALILVVSEETGHTSFAYKGGLHPFQFSPTILNT
ncbi:hypothetical protein SY83_19860 [Paenibacillus swuensis]|uniref:DAC domain-containing protein n=1 Tax=Paenibacillus swuensis TaxID=1178515 RepID=A0A172TN47_9BACL|nr:sporulation-specific diadenylate cyclase CdaS [Paenibacillus swuensis]ANE48173.1 hypothetical protein SY83_19860 [Paenibacillus swuensis]